MATPKLQSLVVNLHSGGGERDRTDDPLLAKQVLSQLSYTPESLALRLTTLRRGPSISDLPVPRRLPSKMLGGSGWI
jgi:hypothetical protein